MGAITLLLLLLGLASAWPHSSAKAQSGPDAQLPLEPSSTESNSLFLTLVPSEDGRELLVRAQTGGTVDGGLYASVGIGETGIKEGWTGIKEGWTMTYSETVQSYVTTAVGLAPEVSLEGRVAISSTAGLATEAVDFVRAYVPNDGPQTIRSADGALELQVTAADTLPAAAYIAVVPSHTPPGPSKASPGYTFVGPVYSIRAAGALAQSEKPFLLRLYYGDGLLAGRAPDSLTVAFWDAATATWQPLDSRVFAQRRYVSTAADQFGTYALVMAENQQEATAVFEQIEPANEWRKWLESLFSSISD